MYFLLLSLVGKEHGPSFEQTRKKEEVFNKPYKIKISENHLATKGIAPGTCNDVYSTSHRHIYTENQQNINKQGCL